MEAKQISLQEARALAGELRDAATVLNDTLSRAVSMGLVVTVDVEDFQHPQKPDLSLVRVSAAMQLEPEN